MNDEDKNVTKKTMTRKTRTQTDNVAFFVVVFANPAGVARRRVSALRGVERTAARPPPRWASTPSATSPRSPDGAAEKGASVRGLRDKARALGGAWET